jgi:hypothetical protein
MYINKIKITGHSKSTIIRHYMALKRRSFDNIKYIITKTVFTYMGVKRWTR